MLNRLLYTIKTLHKVKQPIQFPPFWTEEWLEVAIKELDTRAMIPEQRLAYEMTISANALAFKNERKKMEEAELTLKTEMVQKALQKGLEVSLVADIAPVSNDNPNRDYGA